MKINLELHYTPKSTYLCYVKENSDGKSDMVYEIRDNKLYHVDFDKDDPEITLEEFVKQIKENYEN